MSNAIVPYPSAYLQLGSAVPNVSPVWYPFLWWWGVGLGGGVLVATLCVLLRPPLYQVHHCVLPETVLVRLPLQRH